MKPPFRLCWTALSNRRCCRFCRSAGIRRSPNTATVFDRGRSARQAVHEAQQYIAEGDRWVVDLDLEKFFGAPG
jgi:hypothetical protein